MITRKRGTLAGLSAMAVTLGIPAGLVLATSAPAQACTFAVTQGVSPQCGGGGPTVVTYDLSATPSTVATGDPVTLHITASRNGASPVDVTSQTSFSIDAGSCTANVCTPDTAGGRTITARTNSGGTTSTQIYAITPDRLVIAGPPTATAGQVARYNVYNETAVGALIDDVTGLATVTLGGAACPGAVCTATTTGQQTVTAAWNGMTAETSLVVDPGPTASLVVTPHVSSTWNNVQPATFTAEAFDAWGNDLGDVTQQSSFAITPDGTCTGNTCTVDVGGSHTVTATDGSVSGSITLDASGAIPTVAPTLPAGQVGTRYSHSVLSYTDATTFTQPSDPSTLPPGLTLGQDGTLSGTPTTAGTYTFFVIAVNDNGAENEPTTITIAPGTLPSKPAVSVGDASVQEGDHGRTAVHVTVTLSATSSTPVRVSWHTVNGTARAGSDYVRAHGTLTIPAGQLTGEITVHVVGDRKHERDEVFHIVLTRPRGATLGTARDTVTVVNDD